MKRTDLLFKNSKLPIIFKKIVQTQKWLWSLKKNTFVTWLERKWPQLGKLKPDHKWTHFEHNSWSPQTEGKGRKSQGVTEFEYMESRGSVNSFRKNPRGSFVALCNFSFSERRLVGISLHVLFRFVFPLVDWPIGFSRFYHHIAHFIPAEQSCSYSLKHSYCLPTGRDMERTPDLLHIWGLLLTELTLKWRRYRSAYTGQGRWGHN